MTDLDIELPPARGRKPAQVEMYYIRDLDEHDVAQMYETVGSIPKSVQKMRHSHHLLAGLLARGVKETEAAAISGYQIATISNFKRDPAFRQLLEYYGAEARQVHSDMLSKLKAIGFDTIEALHEKLQANELTAGQMIELSKLVLDRTGFGPKSTVEHNWGLEEKTLEMIKSAIDGEARGKIIDVQVREEPALSVSHVPAELVKEGVVYEFSGQRDSLAEESVETPSEDQPGGGSE